MNAIQYPLEVNLSSESTFNLFIINTEKQLTCAGALFLESSNQLPIFFFI